MLRRYLARHKMRWAARYLARMSWSQRQMFRLRRMQERMFVQMLAPLYMCPSSFSVAHIYDDADMAAADRVEAALREVLHQLHT